MKTRLQSFLLMLAGATDKELAQQVQYLKGAGTKRRRVLQTAAGEGLLPDPRPG
jgi:hypothetical protein